MQTRENLYSVTGEINNDIKNIGYDYEGKILRNSLSSYLYRNTKIAGFLDTLEPMMTEIVGLPKKLKAFWNYTVPKNHKRMN